MNKKLIISLVGFCIILFGILSLNPSKANKPIETIQTPYTSLEFKLFKNNKIVPCPVPQGPIICPQGCTINWACVGTCEYNYIVFCYGIKYEWLVCYDDALALFNAGSITRQEYIDLLVVCNKERDTALSENIAEYWSCTEDCCNC